MQTEQDSSHERVPQAWQALRAEVAAANWELTSAVLEHIQRVFMDQYAHTRRSPATLTREWQQNEYLQVVDDQGRPSPFTSAMRRLYDQTLANASDFRKWLKIAPITEQPNQPSFILLAARWLCHLAGLRHPTVEIFIDPPGLRGLTLVQVRGMDKFESPGCFDIPCAGHVSGMDTAEQALQKELLEELNLAVEDLENLRLVARYNTHPDLRSTGPRNNEHRVLYQARLRADRVAKIRFTDGEVVGLGVYSVPELRALVTAYPERVAGGLSEAMPYYQDQSSDTITSR